MIKFYYKFGYYWFFATRGKLHKTEAWILVSLNGLFMKIWTLVEWNHQLQLLGEHSDVDDEMDGMTPVLLSLKSNNLSGIHLQILVLWSLPRMSNNYLSSTVSDDDFYYY